MADADCTMIFRGILVQHCGRIREKFPLYLWHRSTALGNKLPPGSTEFSVSIWKKPPLAFALSWESVPAHSDHKSHRFGNTQYSVFHQTKNERLDVWTVLHSGLGFKSGNFSSSQQLTLNPLICRYIIQLLIFQRIIQWQVLINWELLWK